MARSSAVVSTVLHRRVVEASVVISARVRVVDPAHAFVRAAGTENDVDEVASPSARGATFMVRQRAASSGRESFAAMRIEERVRREAARARRTR